MQNKLNIRIDNINLKTEAVKFLQDHGWSNYTPKMLKLQEIIRKFLSDYHKNTDVTIGLVHDSTEETNQIDETYSITVGPTLVARMQIKQGVGAALPGEADSGESILKLYDTFAQYSQHGVYSKEGGSMVAQTLLHPLRSLVGNLLSESNDYLKAAEIEEIPFGQMLKILFVVSSIEAPLHCVALTFWSPEMEN